MRKILIILVLALFQLSLAQKLPKNSFWDLMLKNERNEARKKLSNKNNLVSLFEKQILEIESGDYLRSDMGFLRKAVTFDDFQYYMYAFGLEQFIFGDYLSMDWSKNTLQHARYIEENAKISSPIIQSSLNYTLANSHRHVLDYDKYSSLINVNNQLNNWQLVGVFENMNKSGIDIVYEPENYPKDDKLFDTNGTGMVGWYDEKPSQEFFHVLYNHSPYGSGVHYAQTFIQNPTERRVVLGFSSKSAFKIWLNDVLILENSDVYSKSDIDKYRVELSLPKGNNRLLIKLADDPGNVYFAARFQDEHGNKIEGLVDTNQYSEYNTSTKDQLNAKLLPHPIIEFFKNKIKETPKSFINVLALSQVYQRNGMIDEIHELITPYYEKYPKSSLLRELLYTVYTEKEMDEKAEELLENSLNEDPYSQLAVMKKITNFNKIAKKPLSEIEKERDDIKANTKSDFVVEMYNAVIYAKLLDKQKMIETAEKLMEYEILNISALFSKFYDQLEGDKEKTIKYLENLNEKYYNNEIPASLAAYYKNANQKEKIYALYEHYLEHHDQYNFALEEFMDYLSYYNDNEKIIELADKGLENFPYDFQMLERKAIALQNLGKTNEAIKYYEKTLSHFPANATLRKKLNDLKGGEKSSLEKTHFSDSYNYISKNRDKITDNYYGYNLLLDDISTELFHGGGGEIKYTSIYEITSSNGIEELKEMNLSLGYPYEINKAEIVKKDGTVIPADKQGTHLVFNNLNVSDVILLDYNTSFRNTGRFHKDLFDQYVFSSEHPNINSTYRLITDNDVPIYSKVMNEEKPYNKSNITFKKEIIEDKSIYTWSAENQPKIPFYEAFMPTMVDVNTVLHIGTIEDWSEISDWYSDLVRAQIKIDKTVEKAFNEIFPDGFNQFSETERAQKIYQYMAQNLSYSFVDFRQSGYVPQKPGKTLSTKLGDCKDFSTLFLVLGQKANLNANLVLVLTSDYGENNLIFPSVDFNHCIVKVELDGKNQYLELTNKYLPFGSLPTSLSNALALDIPLNSGVESKGVYPLKNIQHIPAIYKVESNIVIIDDNFKIQNNLNVQGNITNIYIENWETTGKDELKDFYKRLWKNSFNSEINIDSIHKPNYTIGLGNFTGKADLTAVSPIKNLGNTKMFEIPVLISPFNRDIVQEDERNYAIKYANYENIEEYHVKLNFILNEDQKFTQIPDNVNFSFKNHSFKMTFSNTNPNLLEVSIIAKTPWDNIEPQDYSEFKKYINNSLNAYNTFVGFK